MVICLERGADLHIVQLIPLPLTVSCFSKIQIGFTFLVSAYPDSPRQRAIKRVCVYRSKYHWPFFNSPAWSSSNGRGWHTSEAEPVGGYTTE